VQRDATVKGFVHRELNLGLVARILWLRPTTTPAQLNKFIGIRRSSV
jgi:hypothetical protein